MLTANCAVCGEAKPMNEYGNPHCSNCDKAGKAGGEVYKSVNPDATEDQILYAERMARQARAHLSRRGYVNPRDFSSTRGIGGPQ